VIELLHYNSTRQIHESSDSDAVKSRME
jgi:hypothetical protein